MVIYRKTIALLFLFLVLVPFSLMVVNFFSQNMAEVRLVRRYVGRVRAFWAAEAGIARGHRLVRDCVLSGGCTVEGTINYDQEECNYEVTTSHLDGNYYQIHSTGFDGQITKDVAAVIQLRDVSLNNFQNAIEAQGKIIIQGSAEIHEPNQYKEDATLDFEDLFGIKIEDIQPWDYHYIDPPNNPSQGEYPIEGVTYIEESGRLKISTRGWQGSGILIVDGDVQITGGTFDGILIVRGEFQIAGNARINGIVYVEGEFVRGQGSGNPDLFGTVLVECDSDYDTELRGNIDITYDPEKIQAALNLLQFIAPHKVAWWEPVE